MHLCVNYVDDGCLATGEGITEEIFIVTGWKTNSFSH